MIKVVTIISTSFNKLKMMLSKFERMGKDDIQETETATSYGFEGNPIKGMTAIHVETSIKGETAIIGFFNKELLTDVGESRMFSTDEDGTLKMWIHCKNDGTAEFGGTTHNLMRYTPLNTELQSFKNSIQAELVKIATGLAGVGGAYTPGVLSIDISGAKIDEIKTL